MEHEYCYGCRKITGHKRALGWGTFFGGLFTLGFSLLFIPFYPKRCIICGVDLSGKGLYKSDSTRFFAETSNAELPDDDMFEEIHTKKCPFCAETIKLEAIKCRFCGEKLDLADVTQQVADRKAKEDIFKNRALCSDGNCVGVIGPDGKCKVCGKPFEQNEDCNIIDVPLERKTNKIKAVIFLTVALFFFAYTIYSGGSIGSFFALIIGLVCGLIGVLNLRGN